MLELAGESSADVDLGITLSIFINTVAEAGVVLLNKEELKAGINAFVLKRVDEGEDRAAAHAEARSIVGDFRRSQNVFG